jgi:hypothetical protein
LAYLPLVPGCWLVRSQTEGMTCVDGATERGCGVQCGSGRMAAYVHGPGRPTRSSSESCPHRRFIAGSYLGLVGAFVGAVPVPTRDIPQLAMHRPFELALAVWVAFSPRRR